MACSLFPSSLLHLNPWLASRFQVQQTNAFVHVYRAFVLTHRFHVAPSRLCECTEPRFLSDWQNGCIPVRTSNETFRVLHPRFSCSNTFLQRSYRVRRGRRPQGCTSPCIQSPSAIDYRERRTDQRQFTADPIARQRDCGQERKRLGTCQEFVQGCCGATKGIKPAFGARDHEAYSPSVRCKLANDSPSQPSLHNRDCELTKGGDARTTTLDRFFRAGRRLLALQNQRDLDRANGMGAHSSMRETSFGGGPDGLPPIRR